MQIKQTFEATPCGQADSVASVNVLVELQMFWSAIKMMQSICRVTFATFIRFDWR